MAQTSKINLNSGDGWTAINTVQNDWRVSLSGGQGSTQYLFSDTTPPVDAKGVEMLQGTNIDGIVIGGSMWVKTYGTAAIFVTE